MLPGGAAYKKRLQACGCPKNLYNVTNSYFSQRTAILSTNSIRMRTEVSSSSASFLLRPGFLEYPVQLITEP